MASAGLHNMRICSITNRINYYVLNCPIHYVSKLQTEITLSTIVNKYIVLSMATQALLPLQFLFCSNFHTTRMTSFKNCQIYRDDESFNILVHSAATQQWFTQIS